MLRRRFLALSAAAGATAPKLHAANVEGRTLLKFGVIADVQYADADPQGERHYRESLPKLKEAVADLARQDLPFTIHLGDTIDRDFASYDALLPAFDALGHPLRNLLGNHDYDVAAERKSGVAARLGLPADFYSFTRGPVRFIMLDTNDISTFKHPADSPETRAAHEEMKRLGDAPNAKPWNGGISERQLEWLEEELAETTEQGGMAIVCGHHPLLPHEPHTAWNHAEILAVLEKHNCARAYLCGHNHAGNEAAGPGGLPCVTFKSLLHEPGVTAYAVVRLVEPGWLVIEGRGRETSRVIDARERK